MISRHSGSWKSRWNRAPSRPSWNAVPGKAGGTARLQDPPGTRDPLQEKPAENRRTEARTESAWRTRGLGGNLRGDATDLFHHPAGGAHIGARIDLRREWHREGVGGAGDP